MTPTNDWRHPVAPPPPVPIRAAPQRYLDFVFSDAAQPLWRRCHQSAGQFYARPVTDAAGAARYTLKELSCTDDFDRVFVYAPTRSALRSPARQCRPESQ